MTFDPGIPVKTQSPGLFPDQMHADLNRLKTLVESEHIFNNTAQVNDGIHKQVRLINKANLVTTPFVNGENGMVYSVADMLANSQVWYQNSAINTPMTCIKAFINFNGLGALSIRTEYNANTVVRNPDVSGSGRYRIFYNVPFVSTGNADKYVVQVTCMANTDTTIGTVRRVSNLSNAMTSTYVDIDTVDRNGNHVDCDYVGVTIFSVT